MSQPCDRNCNVELPGTLDQKLNEFWVGNPWEIVTHGHNLSAFERNRVYLNVNGNQFLDVSHLSGADNDGDGRAVVAADFRNRGLPDLIVRQAGGGSLLLYENQLPPAGYLTVSLRGQASNRQGIGARVIARVQDRDIVRELFPAAGLFSQAPSHIHLGIGSATTIDKLTIRWPSGKVQEFNDLKANRHILIDENLSGAEAIVTVQPGNVMKP